MQISSMRDHDGGSNERFLGANSPAQVPKRPESFCESISLFPIYAMQRVAQCFGIAGQTIVMQSGRTVVVQREIAQGGYSFVYTARDATTSEVFALKKIVCQTSEQSQMAKHEIQIHKSFAHPHLMPLQDYAVVTPQPNVEEYFLLFPFMENGTLRDMIDCHLSLRRPIPEAQILEMFLKICRAVAELHGHAPPLAHRDIKPENVLLSEENEPVLTDLGSVTEAEVTISKRSDALLLQEHAAQFSSMPYRAPELYDVPDGAHISSRTDVWSLGCLLFAMAFGYSPFECAFNDAGEVRIVECTFLRVIGNVKFPARHSYSTAFCDLILWMLLQDASKRPTVFQVIEKLHALVP